MTYGVMLATVDSQVMFSIFGSNRHQPNLKNEGLSRIWTEPREHYLEGLLNVCVWWMPISWYYSSATRWSISKA